MEEKIKSAVGESWADKINVEEVIKIFDILKQRKMLGADIFPAQSDIFKAFQLCPYDDVKVVIVGKYPFTGYLESANAEGKVVSNEKCISNGLCFALNAGSVDPFFIPESTYTITRELESDIYPSVFDPERMSLDYNETWGERQAKQGVLMLNLALTSQNQVPESHISIWNNFTKSVLLSVLGKTTPVIVINLSGLPINYESTIHKIIDLFIPEPNTSEIEGSIVGSRIFTQINDFLIQSEQIPIIW